MRVTELRYDKRYRVRVRATLRYGREAHDLLTEDVGFRGVFLRTDTPPELRQLVRIELTLPDSGEVLTVHGMAVHRVPRDNAAGRAPGIGVQFYAVDKATNAAWVSFVHRVEKTHPEAVERAVALAPPDAPDPVRREHPRFPVALELELRTVDELRTLYTRDVSQGGMFIVTDLVLPPGTALSIEVVHPITRAVFMLEAEVRRVAGAGEVPGLGVSFVRVDEERHMAFIAFVRDTFSQAPPELIEIGDPLLA
jgi:uncharacterized protein (TIGR02266 family)